MPYKSNNTNQDSKSQKGGPANRGDDKAGAKTTGGPEAIDRAEELVAKHLDDQERPVPEARTHPNRNTNKPNIDKPGYGGS
ncbi:hypothetical protein TH63_17995 [Rufibacter radiotolerans]|uniref:Uncharacterized protein n=1 Tax=Rufibacter radiotolerans TaxID=1379910 RepID=A0A0H4VTH9_9BACT|nr:hypothetical protein [Rufibacter radiotolerans]AKQ47104.1 hypothetical protein TH63_17995 [Rufibacter radiotolerans]